MWPWASKDKRAIEDKGYRQVAEEIGEGKVSLSDYVRAFADAQGDGEKAVALYAKRRAKEISSHIHNQLLSPPAPEPKKSASGCAVVFLVGLIIVWVIIVADSKSPPSSGTVSSPPVASQPPPLKTADVSAPPIPVGASSDATVMAPRAEISLSESRSSQMSAQPSSEVEKSASARAGGTADPEVAYAHLVAKMEIQGQYTCPSCTDPLVRCRFDIPSKTLATQAEKYAWVQLLNEANGDAEKALKPLIKSQCRGY